jgi:hypothetical protein
MIDEPQVAGGWWQDRKGGAGTPLLRMHWTNVDEANFKPNAALSHDQNRQLPG